MYFPSTFAFSFLYFNIGTEKISNFRNGCKKNNHQFEKLKYFIALLLITQIKMNFKIIVIKLKNRNQILSRHVIICNFKYFLLYYLNYLNYKLILNILITNNHVFEICMIGKVDKIILPLIYLTTEITMFKNIKHNYLENFNLFKLILFRICTV